MSASIPSQQLPTEPSRRLPVVSWSHQAILETWRGAVAAYGAVLSLGNVEVRHEQHCDPDERKCG